jgi:hypothetical protein
MTRHCCGPVRDSAADEWIKVTSQLSMQRPRLEWPPAVCRHLVQLTMSGSAALRRTWGCPRFGDSNTELMVAPAVVDFGQPESWSEGR